MRLVLRFLTAGESHGPALVVTVEGLPAGLPILIDDVAAELARRRLGYGRGPRMRFEQDDVEFLGGVRHGRTLGSPVAILVRNSEWATGKWNEEMSAAPGETAQPLTQPRPGHADLAGMQKYGFNDARDVLERASARETAARVAAGALAKALLAHIEISVLSHVVQLGAATADPERRPGPDDLADVDSSEVRCFDPDAEHEMIRAIKEAAKAGDSLGGVVEVLGYGVPPGLGSHVHWDRRIDGLLAQALMSIQAMKAVEIGEGMTVAGKRGSEAHDAISWDAEDGVYRRESARAGGIEGGMTTGDLLVARVAMKPLATLNRPVLKTVDVETKEETVSFKERTDVTAVPAAGVVAETMVALVLASEALRKFGGDSLPSSFATTTPTGRRSGDARDGASRARRADGRGQDDGRTSSARSGWRAISSTPTISWSRAAGMPVDEFFANYGEPAFRELEREAVADVCESPAPLVVGCGGGTVVDPENRNRLRVTGVVVWLRAPIEMLAVRVGITPDRPARCSPVTRSWCSSRLEAQRESAYEGARRRHGRHRRADVDEVATAVLDAYAAEQS